MKKNIFYLTPGREGMVSLLNSYFEERFSSKSYQTAFVCLFVRYNEFSRQDISELVHNIFMVV